MNDTSSYSSLFIFFLLTLLAEVLGTIGGFGSSLFTVSILTFLFTFQTVLMVTGLLHVFSNTFKIWLFRKTIDWRLVLWLGVSSWLFSIGGSYVLILFDNQWVRLLLGIFLLAFSSWFLFYPNFQVVASLRNSVLGGSIAGFLAGFVGTGGALRGLVLAAFNLERNFFVGTSAAIDWGVDVSRSMMYWKHGFFTSSLWPYIPVLAASAFLGSYLGKKILARINQESFKKIILVLIAITGGTMILQVFGEL